MACLTKEVALPYLLLPGIAVATVSRYRASNVKMFLKTLYAFVLLAYLPWFAYAGLVTGEFSLFLGDAAPWVMEKVFVYGGDQAGTGAPLVDALTWNLPRSTLTYYREYLAPSFALAPWLVAATVFIVARAAYVRAGADVVLAGSIILFMPSVLVQSVVGERLGHGMTLFVLLYIALAAACVQIADWITRAPIIGSLRGLARVTAATVLSGCLVGTQWLGGKDPTYDLLFNPPDEAGFGTLSLYQDRPLVVQGRFNQGVEEASQWLTANVPTGSTLLVDGGTINALRFFTELAYPTDALFTVTSTDEVVARLASGEVSRDDRIVLGLPSNKFFQGGVRRYRVLFFVFEKDILNSIRQSESRYVVIGPTRLFVTLYLDAARWATQVFRNADVHVYEIDHSTVAPIAGWTLITADATPQVLSLNREQYPEEAAALEQLLGDFGLSTQALVDNTYEQFQRRWVMTSIAPTARIMYSNPLGVFLVPEWEQNVSWFNQDQQLRTLEDYDYLMLHSLRRFHPKYPQLFDDLESLSPVKVFPRLPAFDFGEGWEIYRLPRLRGDAER